MISEKRLAEIREFFGSGGFGPIVNELLDEITALRKIAAAGDWAAKNWDLTPYASKVELEDSLQQWRDGEGGE